MSDQHDGNPELEALLDYLKRTRGFDFTGYKRPTLMRRIQKRMDALGIERYAEYLDDLEVHPQEFAQLFDTILINVTAFFRDAPAWDYLAQEIVPKILATKPSGESIRVWSAGCASGEEAYTLAIVLAEALGLEAARERVKIYATDVDEAALAKARLGAYTAREIEGVPPALVEKYFELVNQRFVFHKELRRSVIFGRHDLIQDAPISKIDLLVCRNTLMYFNTETQSRILDRFHFALSPNGFLFLGKAETLMAYNHAFTPVDLKRRIFAKAPKGASRNHLVGSGRNNSRGEAGSSLVNHVRLREAAFEAGPVAQIVVDDGNALAMANERARQWFGFGTADLGQPLQDLQISYRPVELRSLIDRATAERGPILIKDVEWNTPAKERLFLEVQVLSLWDASSRPLGASISFQDVTSFRRLQTDLEAANHELAAAYEELQSTNEELETTNEELQSTNEELETTNEELQSTNEELETTNEELQSTNEELETMNEELQSTNEELEALNGELAERSAELNEVNDFLESILSSLRTGVAVVDQDLLVRVWNHRSEDLWGLRADEARGKHLLNLDIGLPLEELKQSIRSCLTDGDDHRELVVEATNRRGKAIRCRVTCTPMIGRTSSQRGVILVMEESSEIPEAPASA